MSEDRAKGLDQLRQAYESGILDEDTYRTLVAALVLQVDVEASLEGGGAIAQRDSVAAGAGGAAVRGNVHGDVIVVADPDLLWQAIRRSPPNSDLRRATGRYLKHVVDRYRYLEFKGMGVSDRVALRLPLVEMYIPLKARIELPEGETWARKLHLAGRADSEEEAEAMGQRLSEPAPTLDLLRQHDGLIVLGDPGAGKTTFLKYLALRLAMGQGDDLGLSARLPVLVPLSAYANALANGDLPLHRFIARYYQSLGVDLPLGPMLDEALDQGGALLLLDGLDEVRDLGQRHMVVRRVVDFFAYHRGRGNKFVLTSRIVGYREVRPTTEGLAECTLVDFDEEEIAQFVETWTAALERAARGDTPVAAREAEREREELLASVRRNPGVRRLAANPLLLTILALMKRQGVVLPERRVELYQKYVETLLKHWNLARGLGRPPTRDLDVVETVRVLAPLALWMHQASPGVGLVKREAMKRHLVEIYAGRGHEEPEQAARQFLRDVREHAGLLLERGPGEYGFMHLTFQEYLAAVALALAAQHEVSPLVEALSAHVGDDNWHEVSLLAVGHMGIVQQRDEAAGIALRELIGAAPGQPGQAAVLAGEAVLDAWPGGVTHGCKEHVVQALLETMADDAQVKPPVRAFAGRALAKLGDPRRGVGVNGETGLPDIVWRKIASGAVIEQGAEETRRQKIDYEYWIACYPVTNAQFAVFVADGGYRQRDLWYKVGMYEYWDDGHVRMFGDQKPRNRLVDPGEPFNLDNHPVVNVSWYEADAFSSWLTARLAATEPEGFIGDETNLISRIRDRQYTVRLPTEAEWVMAAQGAPGCALPWDSEPDPNCANYRDTGIGTTSAVGCFPNGVSSYGVLDISGNVREWCWSAYEERGYYDYYDPPMLPSSRVRRGSSFADEKASLACSHRSGGDPDYWDSKIGFRLVVAPKRPTAS